MCEMSNEELSPKNGDFTRDAELLRGVRERILQSAFKKFDEAAEREVVEGRVYLQFAPLDVPSDDILCVLLTKDGVRPFPGEEERKEQLYLFFTSESNDFIWVEHINDGIHEKFSLTPFGLDTITDDDMIIDDADFFTTVPEVEPSPEDLSHVVKPEHLESAAARLATLRELIDRFELTTFS